MHNLVRKLAVALCAGALFTAVVQASDEEVPANITGATNINAEQLIELAQTADNLVIIDSRKASDHEEGFIEGSVILPDTDTTPETLAKHVATKDTPVVFYCNGIRCDRSLKAAKLAIDIGYSKVYWYRLGWEEWLAKGYPVAK